MFRLSPLRLRVFNSCRLRYKYQYVERRAARLRPQDTAGSLVHNLLCDFFAKVPAGQRSRELLLEMFRERWDALSSRYLRMPGVERLRDAAIGQLERFVRRQDLRSNPYLVEAAFQMQLAPDVLLFGRVDRIDEEPDRSLHVIDYKTGSHPEEVDASQLRLYAIMAEEKLQRPVSKASFWYLDDGRIWTTELREDEKRSARRQALAAAREMQNLAAFPPSVAPHCAHCPYLHSCQSRDEIARRRQEEGW